MLKVCFIGRRAQVPCTGMSDCAVSRGSSMICDYIRLRFVLAVFPVNLAGSASIT